ncbi:MAG: HEAT repeat domain-containing protein [Acidimicrobiales bacterium]|nr:HEAT repeat domain-containing protein [Acidimicrobiales bacterium]
MTRRPAAARRRAAVLAGHRGDARAARHALTDPDPGVRASAVGALERVGELTGADLEQLLTDPSAAVRRRACEAVALRPGDAPPSLLRVLAEDDATVVESAAWASGEREPAEPGVVAVLAELTTGHPDALVREAAVAALGAIGDDAGLPAILAATHDKATVRRRAVLALAPFEGADVDGALEKARDDRDWQVRQAAEDLT